MKPIRKLLWAMALLAILVIAVGIGFYERPLSFFNQLLYTQMALAGAHSRNVTIAGHRMHYYVIGPSDGAPVVLVHGLGGQAEDWRNLAPFLRAAGYRVYAPDLFGYGRSERPTDFSYSVPDEAAAVVAYMDAMGVKQADLGGLSMGGWIVQKIAADHPDRIRKLMLFDSAGLAEKPAWNTALFTPTSPAELDQLWALLVPNPPAVPSFVARDVLRVSHGHAWVIQRALASMLTGRDATDSMLAQFKMPVLIVWGKLDHIMPVEQGEKMHQLVPQSQIDFEEGCGHLAPIQCADRVGPKVRDFLKQ